jgi:hypothetical protein
VNFERNEILVYESYDFGVVVRFGFQPSTCASGRRGTEVDEERFVLFLGQRNGGFGVSDPVNRHDRSSLLISQHRKGDAILHRPKGG